MNYNLYNPYNIIPTKTPQQLQNEYSNLLQQYQGMYNNLNGINNQNNIPNSTPSVNVPSTNGTYTKVSSYNEVENYPTPTDGTATLFFDFEHGVFWSKKFSNGQHIIQSFAFRPLNQNGDITKQEVETKSNKEEVAEVTEIAPETPKQDYKYNELVERLEKLENKFLRLNSSKQNKSRIVKDEVLL